MQPHQKLYSLIKPSVRCVKWLRSFEKLGAYRQFIQNLWYNCQVRLFLKRLISDGSRRKPHRLDWACPPQGGELTAPGHIPPAAPRPSLVDLNVARPMRGQGHAAVTERSVIPSPVSNIQQIFWQIHVNTCYLLIRSIFFSWSLRAVSATCSVLETGRKWFTVGHSLFNHALFRSHCMCHLLDWRVSLLHFPWEHLTCCLDPCASCSNY